MSHIYYIIYFILFLYLCFFYLCHFVSLSLSPIAPNTWVPLLLIYNALYVLYLILSLYLCCLFPILPHYQQTVKVSNNQIFIYYYFINHNSRSNTLAKTIYRSQLTSHFLNSDSPTHQLPKKKN